MLLKGGKSSRLCPGGHFLFCHSFLKELFVIFAIFYLSILLVGWICPTLPPGHFGKKEAVPQVRYRTYNGFQSNEADLKDPPFPLPCGKLKVSK